MNKDADKCTGRKSFVVFSPNTEIWYLFWLRKGFKHCYLIIQDNGKWISIDPMSSHIDVVVHNLASDFCLATWLKDEGMCVVPVRHRKPVVKSLPASWVSCVEVTKRVLGIRNWWIWTPYQLYKHLEKDNNYV